MAKKKPRPTNGFAFFDVFYEDGGRSSNRRVPRAELEGLEGDAPALAFIEEQDRSIAELSGNPARSISRIVRSGAAAVKASPGKTKGSAQQTDRVRG